jgi:hypothetical protein
MEACYSRHEQAAAAARGNGALAVVPPGFQHVGQARAVRERPHAFLQTMAALMPRELKIETGPFEGLTDDDLFVDERDDLMSATRYGHMMLRLARTKPQPTIRRPTADGSTVGFARRSDTC